MDLGSIARELVAGCREGREAENLGKLYSEHAVSVEGADFGGTGREAVGLEAIRGKHAWWDANFEVLSATVSDPMLHGDDRFAVLFGARTRNRETGAEEEMTEVAVYHVADGRIVREEFFYAPE
ncbi:SnoaL-like domain-containing protein [Jannaschia sp. 2305UL9-9]|uniref:SnoaL-like domain-containing protein n=1 Tax=Jannaschia sp. 2305UL9-9 TaxID=3121638 RepID=UPI003526F01C